MAKKKKINGALILTGAMFLAKLIGALYRVPLTNALGAQGMGMYQLIFPIYALIVTALASGIPIAMSKMVAECNALNISSKKVIGTGIMYSLILSIIASCMLLMLSGAISRVQGDESLKLGYYAITPSLIFVGIISVLKGYFQGNFNMFPTAISYVIEQGFKLGIGLLLAYKFGSKGLIYSVVGAILGVTISEIICFVVLVIIYFVTKSKYQSKALPLDNVSVVRKYVNMVSTITIGSIMLPLSHFIDSLLVVKLLVRYGREYNQAQAMYGILSGTVHSLINLPVVLILSLSIVVIPSISRSMAEHSLDDIVKKCSVTVKIAYMIGVPIAVLMWLFSKELIGFLYPNFSAFEVGVASSLLRISVVSVVFLALMQIFSSLLQAMDKAKTASINLGISIMIKVILMLILISRYDIYGVATSSVIMSLICTALNILSYRSLLGKKARINRGIIGVSISTLIMGGIAFLIFYYIMPNIWGVFLASGVALSIYLLLIIIFKVFTNEELKFFPMAKVWIGLSNKLQLKEKL